MQNLTLTNGVDAIVGTAGNDVINASPVSNGIGGLTASFTALDNIDGGAGNDVLNITSTAALDLASATGATVKNVETANVLSTSTVKGDFSGWAGLTKLNVTEVGGNNGGVVKAAATTAVSVTDSAQGAGNISVSGGSNVTVASTGAATAGANTAKIDVAGAKGAVSVTSALANAAASYSAGQITINGGQTINVKQSVTNSDKTGAVTITEGNVSVTGDATTTQVTVTQAATAVAAAEVAAKAAVIGAVDLTETAVVTLSATGLASGQSLTIGGLTYTATAANSQADLETAFGSILAGTKPADIAGKGTFSGALTGFASGAATAGHAITFTAATINQNVADLTYTNSNALTSVVVTQGSTAATAAAAVAAKAAVAGVTAGTVTISDVNSADTTGTKANTIATVNLDGYGAATINSNALKTLSLANSDAAVQVVDNTATVTNTALNVTVNNLGKTAAAGLTDATINTLTLTASQAKSALNVTAAALTTLNVAGDQKLDLSGSTMAKVTSVTSTNTAGVTVALNAGSTGTFGDGADVVTVGAGATKTVALGAGDDTAIISTLGTGGKVDGGTGTNTLQMLATDAQAASADNTFAQAVTGFQKLALTGTNYTATVDAAILGGFNDVTTAGATSLTVNNIASGATLHLTGTGTGYTVNETNAAAGTADILNVALTANASTSFGALTAAKVETINVTATDSSTTPAGTVVDSFTIAGNDVKTVNLSGTAATNLTATSTAITSFDASGLKVAGAGAAGTGVSWTSGNLAAAATIKGSANGGDYLDASATTAKAVTITTFAGTNTIKGGGVADTLTGGTGNDTIYGGAGNDTIVGGGGSDKIYGGAGADVITVSGGKNTIVQTAGDSGANTSNAIQTSELTSTFDVIKGLVAGDKLDLSAFAIGTGVNGAIATADLVSAGTNLAAVDNKVVFVSGTYDAAAGVFTYAANGADTAVTYDTDATAGTVAGQSIILVGVHLDATHTVSAATAGIITLA